MSNQGGEQYNDQYYDDRQYNQRPRRRPPPRGAKGRRRRRPPTSKNGPNNAPPPADGTQNPAVPPEKKKRKKRKQDVAAQAVYKCVRSCCTHRITKYIVIFSTFLIGLALIAVPGILAIVFYFLEQYRSYVTVFPYIFFNIYSIIFGLSFILVGTGLKFITHILVFLYSYYHRAIFIIFSGTLAILSFHPFCGLEWVGYLTGSLIIFFGALYFCVGCCDSKWQAQQNEELEMTRQGGKNKSPTTSSANAEAGVGGTSADVRITQQEQQQQIQQYAQNGQQPIQQYTQQEQQPIQQYAQPSGEYGSEASAQTSLPPLPNGLPPLPTLPPPPAGLPPLPDNLPPQQSYGQTQQAPQQGAYDANYDGGYVANTGYDQNAQMDASQPYADPNNPPQRLPPRGAPPPPPK